MEKNHICSGPVEIEEIMEKMNIGRESTRFNKKCGRKPLLKFQS